jgi:hypothetical protein
VPVSLAPELGSKLQTVALVLVDVSRKVQKVLKVTKMRTERFTFKFGIRTKIVPVQIDENQPIIRSLEKAVREVLSKDRLLKDKANKQFFLEQFNEFSNSNAEIDENTLEIEINNSVPISFMFWEDHDFVSKPTTQ